MKLKFAVIIAILFISFSMASAQNHNSNFGLQYIQNEPWARVNDTVKIVGLFNNTKNYNISAKLNVELYYNGELLNILSSDELEIEPNSEANLTTYFKPQFSGTYQIKAHAVYDKKVSQTKESELSVLDPEAVPMATTELIGMLIGVSVLITVLHLIFNRQNKKEPREIKRYPQ